MLELVTVQQIVDLLKSQEMTKNVSSAVYSVTKEEWVVKGLLNDWSGTLSCQLGFAEYA